MAKIAIFYNSTFQAASIIGLFKSHDVHFNLVHGQINEPYAEQTIPDKDIIIALFHPNDASTANRIGEITRYTRRLSPDSYVVWAVDRADVSWGMAETIGVDILCSQTREALSQLDKALAELTYPRPENGLGRLMTPSVDPEPGFRAFNHER